MPMLGQVPGTSTRIIMDQDQTAKTRTSFPLTQRELVGLAFQRGARRHDAGPAAPHSQRERVRLSLALGLGRADSAGRAARRGIVR
jgi:hypothetical protein